MRMAHMPLHVLERGAVNIPILQHGADDMMNRIILTVIALSLPLLGCQPAEGNSADQAADRSADLEAIRQVHEEHMAAVYAKDVDRFMVTVMDSFILMPPDDPGAHGAEEVREWSRAFYDHYTIEKLDFTSMDYTIHGDWAAIHYHYDWRVVPTGEGEVIEDVGQGLYVYRRQPDGSWKLAYDIWNSDGPAADRSGDS